jgi:hypothetical protein
MYTYINKMRRAGYIEDGAKTNSGKKTLEAKRQLGNYPRRCDNSNFFRLFHIGP